MSNNIDPQFDMSESNRCLGCKVARCREHCPIGNDIPQFLQLVKLGKYEQAVDIIGHPFGEICGYVCPQDIQCQGGCVLGVKGNAVQMGRVERAVFAQNPYPIRRKSDLLSNIKVAVVGGGVAGITLATKLYEQGAEITVFERDTLLSTLKLIPSFRLPNETLQRIECQIDGKFTIVKQDVDSQQLVELQQRFDVVYLSIGTGVLYNLGIDGEQFATPYSDFLRSNLHFDKVVVIGGGNTAMDCARLAKHNGCNVSVAYRRQRGDMPAFQKEIDAAEQDGVELVYNVAPVKLEKSDGKLLLTIAKTVSEGRGKLTVTDETHQIACDCVVSALGSKFDSAIYQNMQIREDVKHPLPNVYAGGDAVGGKTVAQAVADGLTVAREIISKYTKSR